MGFNLGFKGLSRLRRSSRKSILQRKEKQNNGYPKYDAGQSIKEPENNMQPVTYELQNFLCQKATDYCRSGRGPHVEKGTVSGIPNRPNYCVIFTVYKQFTNVAVGRIIQPGGSRAGDPCINP